MDLAARMAVATDIHTLLWYAIVQGFVFYWLTGRRIPLARPAALLAVAAFWLWLLAGAPA
jgi:uncharacterized membrane protein